MCEEGIGKGPPNVPLKTHSRKVGRGYWLHASAASPPPACARTDWRPTGPCPRPAKCQHIRKGAGTYLPPRGRAFEKTFPIDNNKFTVPFSSLSLYVHDSFPPNDNMLYTWVTCLGYVQLLDYVMMPNSPCQMQNHLSALQ